MASDPSWDDIFGPASTSSPQPDGSSATPVSASVSAPPPASGPAGSPPTAPLSRRALRDAQDADRPERAPQPEKPRKKKRRGGNAGWIIAIVVVLALIVGAGVTGWVLFEDKIREVLGIEAETDYSGTGNGEEVVVVISPGDIGSDVATTLRDAGVTMTFQSFYELLLNDPDITFEPGNYQLQKQMSAASALAALQDPANRLINQVTIREGVTANSALESISEATEIPLEELQAEAANFTQFGVPATAPSIEGYLFPATYTFDPGITAHDAIQTLVDKMTAELDAAGVAPENRFTVLTMASIIQRESGPVVEDMAKISRVFQNRLDRGMNLQSDATVHYGLGDTSSVWTNPEDRADASNPYNTYANPGLPIGPIGLPGADAINAAMHPVDGSWLYFVTVNLKTGETVFSNTLAEHERAADQLFSWCKESAENDAYCA